MKRRCNFELQFCELSGIPSSYDAIRIVVDHRDGKRRYAASDVIKPSFTTASVPILGFQCGIYPTKTVQLRLMGGTSSAGESEGRRTPRLLGRKDSLNWQLLATAPLPLGQLAPSTAADQDPGDASTVASSGATPMSTRGSSMDQATISQLPGMGGSSATVGSSAATAGSSNAALISTPEGGRAATSPFRVMSGADDDDEDAGSDSGQLFSTDSLAAAAASLVAHQQQQEEQEQRDHSTVRLGGKSLGKGRHSSGEEPSMGTAPQVAGLWVAGDSQVTRLTLQWDTTSGSTEGEVMVLEQEVVVIAKLLEPRRSFGNLFGLRLSPSKTSLNQQQQAASPRSSLGGGGTPRRTSQVWDPQCDTVPETDQGPAEAVLAPRRVTFDPTAGSPSGPSSQPLPRPPQPSTRQTGEPAAAFGGAAGAGGANNDDEEAQESARQDFLRILSALATASSIDESEAGSIIAAASPAQLAAAASLPRAPSAKDLAMFAAAAGLPLQTVTQAAASSRLSVAGTASDAGSSRGSTPRDRGNYNGNNNTSNMGSVSAEGSAHEKVQLAAVPVATATSPADAARGLVGPQPRGEMPAAAPAGADDAAAAAAAMAAAAAAAAGVTPSGAAAPHAAAPKADKASGEQLSAAVVSVAPAAAAAAAAPSPNTAEVDLLSILDTAWLAPRDKGPAAAAQKPAEGQFQQQQGSAPAAGAVVSSTAMVTSSPTGSSGWEPQQLAVVTLSTAVPEDQPHKNQPQTLSKAPSGGKPGSQPSPQVGDGTDGARSQLATASSESTAAWVQATLAPGSNTTQVGAAAAAVEALAAAASPSPGDVSWGHPDAAAGASGREGEGHSSTAATAGTSERSRSRSRSNSNTSNLLGSSSSSTSRAPQAAADAGTAAKGGSEGVARSTSSRGQQGAADSEGWQPAPEAAAAPAAAALRVSTGLGGGNSSSRGGGMEPVMQGQASPLKDLSDRYNSLVGHRQPAQHAQHAQHSTQQAGGTWQVLEEEELMSPQQILSVMPGLAAAGSTVDTEPLLGPGFRTSNQGSMMTRAPHNAADRQDSRQVHPAAQGSGHTGPRSGGPGGAGGPGTATAGPKPGPAAPAGPEEVKSVGAAAAGAADWQSVVPPSPGGYGDTPPPPPSPRLLAAAAIEFPALAASGTAAAAGASDVQEMLAYPAYSTAAAPAAAPSQPTTATSSSSSSASPAPELAATAATFMAPVNLQQQKSAVPTASGHAYPEIMTPGNPAAATASTSAQATGTAATGTASRLSAVLAVQQPAGNRAAPLGRTASGSSSSGLFLLASSSVDVYSSTSPGSAAAGSLVSLLTAAATAALAAAATVLPPVLAALAAAAVGMSVFLLRQATWLFNISWRMGLRVLLWAALAGPRAAAWLAQQAWNGLASSAQMATRMSTSSSSTSSTSTSSSSSSLSAPMITAGSSVLATQSSSLGTSATPGLLQGSTATRHATPAPAAAAASRSGVGLPYTNRPASRVSKPSALWPFGQATSSLVVAPVAPHTAGGYSASSSPAAADIAAARTIISSPGANSSRVPPSLGGPASTVWAPSAGRSTAASLAGAALAPLALLLQWPLSTATVLFEVLVWGVSLMVGAPLAVGLGLLRYIGLLPTRQLGPPVLSSVAAAGGLAAQGEVMPGADASAVAAGMVGSPALSAAAREVAAQAATLGCAAGERPVSEMGGSLSSTSVPLSSTVVPEEHEVSGQQVLRADSVTTRPRGVTFTEPLTPAPSMEVPGSVAGRTWSISLLTAALSRLGSATLAAAPALTAGGSLTATGPAAPAAATGSSVSAGGAGMLRSSSGRASEAAAAGPRAGRGMSNFSGVTPAAAPALAPAGDVTPADSSSSRSSSASVSRSSSTSSIDNGFGSSWAFGKRRLRPLTDAAAAAKAILQKGRLGMRPVAATTAAGTSSAAVPSVVPPPGNAAGSVIQQVNSSIDSFTGQGGWWPSWASWYPSRGALAAPLSAAATTTAAAPGEAASGGVYTAGHAIPGTPPSTPNVAGSFSCVSSSNGVGPSRLLAASHPANPSHTTLSKSSWPLAYVRPGGPADTATSTAVAPAATWSYSTASSSSSGYATLSVNSILRAAAAATTDAWAMFVVLVVGPVLWLWAAWAQLGQLGVKTAAWLVGACLWWAVLPARLVWWGVLMAWRVVPGAWEGFKWAAEMVAVPHDDRSEVHTGYAAAEDVALQES